MNQIHTVFFETQSGQAQTHTHTTHSGGELVVQAASAEAWIKQQPPGCLQLVLIDAFDGQDAVPAGLLDTGEHPLNCPTGNAPVGQSHHPPMPLGFLNDLAAALHPQSAVMVNMHGGGAPWLPWGGAGYRSSSPLGQQVAAAGTALRYGARSESHAHPTMLVHRCQCVALYPVTMGLEGLVISNTHTT